MSESAKTKPKKAAWNKGLRGVQSKWPPTPATKPPVPAPASYPLPQLTDEKNLVRDLARSLTAIAVQTLAAIAEHGHNEAARVSAANSLLDRGWGKPTVAPESESNAASRIEVVFGTRHKTIDAAPTPQ